MYNIKLLNKISKVGLDDFDENYTYSEDMTNEDAILVRSASLHDYDFGKNLKAIARAGAGVNNIPIDKCSENGIVVFNTPGANANAVKELVLCALFLSSRKIVESIRWVDTLKDDENIFKTDEKMLELALTAAKRAELSIKIFTGRVVSGDQFISSKDKKKWLVETFDGTCAEMEGASIGHVASLNKIPYLVVRAISDKADDSAEMDYPSFAAMAIDNSVALMTEFVKLC